MEKIVLAGSKQYIMDYIDTLAYTERNLIEEKRKTSPFPKVEQSARGNYAPGWENHPSAPWND